MNIEDKDKAKANVEELRENFNNFCNGVYPETLDDNTVKDDIFDWFAPFISELLKENEGLKAQLKDVKARFNAN